jgi:hypothetical protein
VNFLLFTQFGRLTGSGSVIVEVSKKEGEDVATVSLPFCWKNRRRRMTNLSKIARKFNPRRLRYGRDFVIEPLRMGSNHDELLELEEKESVGEEAVDIFDPVEEEPKMVVVRGFVDRVQEYMKRKGWAHG